MFFFHVTHKDISKRLWRESAVVQYLKDSFYQTGSLVQIIFCIGTLFLKGTFLKRIKMITFLFLTLALQCKNVFDYYLHNRRNAIFFQIDGPFPNWVQTQYNFWENHGYLWGKSCEKNHMTSCQRATVVYLYDRILYPLKHFLFLFSFKSNTHSF